MNCFRSLYLWVDLQLQKLKFRCCPVVNCFRSLYLWVDLQLRVKLKRKGKRCELLSFFVPLGWFTATVVCYISRCVLWIAFVLWTFGLIYSVLTVNNVTTSVVNCFRSLYLWVDLQPLRKFLKLLRSCELLSFFVPLGWFTAHKSMNATSPCCELLSFFVPLGWFTANFVEIAYLYHVVNCFRSLYLWVDLQLIAKDYAAKESCELLSFFVPLGWFTAWKYLCKFPWQLWIAFVLCTFGLIYSASDQIFKLGVVVNCFRSLYLWVDLQLSAYTIPTLGVVNCFRSLYLWVDLQLQSLMALPVSSCELLSFFVP